MSAYPRKIQTFSPCNKSKSVPRYGVLCIGNETRTPSSTKVKLVSIVSDSSDVHTANAGRPSCQARQLGANMPRDIGQQFNNAKRQQRAKSLKEPHEISSKRWHVKNSATCTLKLVLPEIFEIRERPKERLVSRVEKGNSRSRYDEP